MRDMAEESQYSSTKDHAAVRSWQEFCALADEIAVPEDFLFERGDVPPQQRAERLFCEELR